MEADASPDMPVLREGSELKEQIHKLAQTDKDYAKIYEHYDEYPEALMLALSNNSEMLDAQMSGTRVGRLHEFAFFACAFVFSVVFFASVHIHPLLFPPFFDCYMPKSYRLYYYYCNKNDSILFSYSITISL